MPSDESSDWQCWRPKYNLQNIRVHSESNLKLKYFSFSKFVSRKYLLACTWKAWCLDERRCEVSICSFSQKPFGSRSQDKSNRSCFPSDTDQFSDTPLLNLSSQQWGPVPPETTVPHPLLCLNGEWSFTRIYFSEPNHFIMLRQISQDVSDTRGVARVCAFSAEKWPFYLLRNPSQKYGLCITKKTLQLVK